MLPLTAHPGVIELGPVELEEALLYKQLRSDFKDDWFPDPKNFADMIENGIVSERIIDNFETNHGQYVPQRRDLFNIPKPNFTLRYALETSLCDRALYHGLTTYLIPPYDPLIPWNVFNHRYDHVKPSRGHVFKRAIPAWKDFIGTVRSALADQAGTNTAFLLSTDISDYYDHIELSRLQQTLTDLIPKLKANSTQKSQVRARITVLFDCLRLWCYDESRGLPQNRDASSFLGNIYLNPVDSEMLARGYGETYFRYMDDIKIVCKTEDDARWALKKLSIALRSVGLSLNSKKTIITPSSDKQKICECLDEGSAEVQQIDEMWRSRNRDVIIRSFPLLKQLTLANAAPGHFDSKDFRFCLNRLSSLALCPDVGVPDAYFDDLTRAIMNALNDCPACTGTLARYLLVAPVKPSDLAAVASFLCDQSKCLYTWQNYHLWSLLARREYFDVTLLRGAMDIIGSDDDTPTRAGATLYVGVMGDSVAKGHIAKHFSSLHSSLGQRCALIALHEVPYAEVRPHIKSHVRKDLKHVYRCLKRTPGIYYAPLERTPLTDLINVDSHYD